MRSGVSADSPFLLLNPAQGAHQNGRLCQSTLPNTRNTTSNVLAVQLVSNADSTVGTGFRLTYMELGLGCGGRLQLSIDQNELTISSPNYPRIPNAHSECIWVIMAPAGKRIQMEFVENFYVR